MTRVLVIGGTGFIGLNLVDALLARGLRVRCTRRKSSITVYLRKRPVELVDANLEDSDSLATAMKDCDVVYYAAAPYPRYSTAIAEHVRQATACANAVVKAAIGSEVRRVIVTSSTGLLSRNPVSHGSKPQPASIQNIPIEMPTQSVYQASKWATHHTFAQAREAGLEVSSILAGGCIGPWDIRAGTGGMLVGAATYAMPWFTDGLVHLVDVRDVVRAHIAAAHPQNQARDYLVPGHAIQLSTVLDDFVQRYGGSVPQEKLSAKAGRVRADREERDAEQTRQRVPFPREMVDIVCAGQPIASAADLAQLGLTLTPLPEALEAAHQWFRRYGYIPKHISVSLENAQCLPSTSETTASLS